MDNIILTSTGFSDLKIAKKIKEFFGGDVIEKRVAIITVVSDEEGRSNFSLLLHSQLSEIGFEKVVFFDIEKRYARELLDFDVVCVNGGNAYSLLDWAKRSGFDEVVREFLQTGGLYLGADAGSLIAGVSIEVLDFTGGAENVVELSDFSGLGLLDQAVFPHYTKEREEAILEYEKNTGFSVVRLADGMALTGKEGKRFEIIERLIL